MKEEEKPLVPTQSWAASGLQEGEPLRSLVYDCQVANSMMVRAAFASSTSSRSHTIDAPAFGRAVAVPSAESVWSVGVCARIKRRFAGNNEDTMKTFRIRHEIARIEQEEFNYCSELQQFDYNYDGSWLDDFFNNTSTFDVSSRIFHLYSANDTEFTFKLFLKSYHFN